MPLLTLFDTTKGVEVVSRTAGGRLKTMMGRRPAGGLTLRSMCQLSPVEWRPFQLSLSTLGGRRWLPSVTCRFSLSLTNIRGSFVANRAGFEVGLKPRPVCNCSNVRAPSREADEPVAGRRSQSAKHCASCHQLNGGHSNYHTPHSSVSGAHQWVAVALWSLACPSHGRREYWVETGRPRGGGRGGETMGQ